MCFNENLIRELNHELAEPLDWGTVAAWKIQQDPGMPACLQMDGKQASLRYPSLPHLCRLLGLAAEHLGEQVTLEEQARFTELSFMVDCSRNAVPRVETVKKLLRRMALMGYHALLLYTEDTYELPSYPYFGYLRGRYTRQELREIDDYAALFGIEVIPCIQTLAHLNAIFHWEAFRDIHDTRDILLCDEEKTYALIREMVVTCAECFRSRKIHVGMDEAELLGKGTFEARHGYEPRSAIMLRHLGRVAEICRSCGLQPMMWSDMFIKNLRGLPETERADHVQEIRSRIPQDVTLVYWDYYARTKEKYDRNLEEHLALSQRVAFAGGAWRWSGFAPLLDHSLLASRLALSSCLEKKISRVMVTAWGDDGAECGLWVVLPVLQYYAEVCYSGDVAVDRTLLSRRLYSCAGVDFEDMMQTSALNYVPHNPAPGKLSSGPAKYLFYQDPLLGLFDCHVAPETADHFRACAAAMARAAARNPREEKTFRTLEALARVLADKCDFGVALKEAYDRRDMEQLAALENRCGELVTLVEAFLAALRRQWREENKEFGFEVLDLRIGGLIRRLQTTAETIGQFRAGEIPAIEVLEAEKLPFGCDRADPYGPLENCEWSKMVTAMEI